MSKPRIGYENLLLDTGATITATTGTAGYEHANAYDWLPATSYLSGSSGASYIKASFGSGITKAASYFAIYNHTLTTNSGTITLQYSSDDSSWTSVFPAFTPTNNAVIYKVFPIVSARYWRVLITSTPASYIGEVSFGQDFELERGARPGFMPPTLARDTQVSNSVSQNGYFLGRSVIRSGITGAINLDQITEAWAREVWLPFIIHAETKPFFLQWNNVEYPYESAFVWTEGKIESLKHAKRNLLSMGIKYRGFVE